MFSLYTDIDKAKASFAVAGTAGSFIVSRKFFASHGGFGRNVSRPTRNFYSPETGSKLNS